MFAAPAAIACTLFFSMLRGIYSFMDSDKEKQSSAQDSVSMKTDRHKQEPSKSDGLPLEFFGPKGLEPTRYGDWEQKGRCTDF